MTSKPEKPLPDQAENAQGVDPIDEDALESFPASNPPTFTGATVSPSSKPTPRQERVRPAEAREPTSNHQE
jgi:hypothetical protein